MSIEYTQAERDYQLARPNETSVAGLTAYRITTLIVVEIAVIIRLWVRRRFQRIPFKSDDYTLIVSAVRTFARLRVKSPF